MFMQLLSITENTRLDKIRNEFTLQYPFLKIDFLKGEATKIRLHKHEKINTANKVNKEAISVSGYLLHFKKKGIPKKYVRRKMNKAKTVTRFKDLKNRSVIKAQFPSA